MMKPRLLLGLLALLATAMPAPVPAAQQEQERLGRLFFTPAQRSSLDVARGQRARTALATETDQEAAPVSQSITYGGLIRRDDGRTTVWLNNQAVHDTDPAGAGAVVTRVRPDGRITLQAPQSSRSVELKPGQSVELLSGTIEEGYSRRLSASEPKPKPGAKPVADARKGKPSPSEAARAAEQEREERQQQIIEDAVSQAISGTAAARPGAPPAAPPPPQAPAR